MLLIVFAGKSGSGKTTVIRKLTEKLAAEGFRVGCIKHCPHGFDMDHEGKDSYNFRESGAEGIIVSSPERIGIIRNRNSIDLKELAIDNFMDFDFIFAEGFRDAEGVKKIELLREEISTEEEINDSIAVFSDIILETDKLLFDINDTEKIVKFLKDLKEKESKALKLKVNDENLELNQFMRKMLRETIAGMIGTLDRKDEKIKKIDIKMEV